MTDKQLKALMRAASTITLVALCNMGMAATSPKCPGEDGYYYTNDRSSRNPRAGGFVSHSANVGDYVFIAPTAAVCGSASVLEFAKVYGNAVIMDEAEVTDKSRVYGDARVSGTAMVSGEAKVSDHALVTGDAIVEGIAWIRGHYIADKGVFTEGTHTAPDPQIAIDKARKQAEEEARRKADAAKKLADERERIRLENLRKQQEALALQLKLEQERQAALQAKKAAEEQAERDRLAAIAAKKAAEEKAKKDRIKALEEKMKAEDLAKRETYLAEIHEEIRLRSSVANIEWQKTYGDQKKYFYTLTAVNPTDDGGILLTGNMYKGGYIRNPSNMNIDAYRDTTYSTKAKIFLIKLDSNGDIVWEKELKRKGIVLNTIKLGKNKWLVPSVKISNKKRDGIKQRVITLSYIDSNGEVIEESENITLPNFVGANSFEITPDQNFVISSLKYMPEKEENKRFAPALSLLGSDGRVLWDKTFQEGFEFNQLIVEQDGFIARKQNDYSKIDLDADYYAHINLDGDIISDTNTDRDAFFANRQYLLSDESPRITSRFPNKITLSDSNRLMLLSNTLPRVSSRPDFLVKFNKKNEKVWEKSLNHSALNLPKPEDLSDDSQSAIWLATRKSENPEVMATLYREYKATEKIRFKAILPAGTDKAFLIGQTKQNPVIILLKNLVNH